MASLESSDTRNLRAYALWDESVKILTHFHRLNPSETLVTHSYGDTFPRVSERVSKQSAAERVSKRMSTAERTSERVAHFSLRRVRQIYPTVGWNVPWDMEP